MKNKIKQTKQRIVWIEGAIRLYKSKKYSEEETINALKLFTKSLEELWKN